MSKPPSGHWYRVFKNIEISKLCFSCNGWPQFGSEHSFFRDELDIMSTSSGGSTSSFSTATAVESHTIRGYPEAFWQPEVLEQFLPKHYQNWICHEHQLLPNITKPHVVKICWSPTIVQCFRLFQESPSGPEKNDARRDTQPGLIRTETVRRWYGNFMIISCNRWTYGDGSKPWYPWWTPK